MSMRETVGNVTMTPKLLEAILGSTLLVIFEYTMITSCSQFELAPVLLALAPALLNSKPQLCS